MGIQYLCIPDSVAQLVEQLTLNHRVQGSNPCGVTKKSMQPFALTFLLFDIAIEKIIIEMVSKTVLIFRLDRTVKSSYEKNPDFLHLAQSLILEKNSGYTNTIFSEKD